MVDFSKWPACYWSDRTKANYLQRQIIIHSLLYYVLDVNVIDDKDFDSIAKQLVSLQTSMCQIEASKTTYWYLLYDFDGSTGFYIPDRLDKHDYEYLMGIANHVYKQYQESQNKNIKMNRKE